MSLLLRVLRHRQETLLVLLIKMWEAADFLGIYRSLLGCNIVVAKAVAACPRTLVMR